MPTTPVSSPASSPTGPTGASGPVVPEITHLTLDETIIAPPVKITNQQGTAANGDNATHTTFETTDKTAVVDITKNLVGIVSVLHDDMPPVGSEKAAVLASISDYASKIQCSDFHGKGTIDDYSALFEAASKIATDAKQMTLDIDVEGFNEFGAAADELSKLFTSFTLKLQTINIIDDMVFLRSIASALAKIWNLSEVFGKFKKTILATATVELPKSAHDTKVLVEGVMNEINCAMTYISNFVTPDPDAPEAAKLSDKDKLIISKAVSTIDNWSTLCDQGVTIAMANNPDVQYLKQASQELKSKATVLGNSTALLRTKLSWYNLS
jgi:hypothetical protein